MDAYEQAVQDEMWRQSCLFWVNENKILSEKGKILEFANHRFLKDIFDDNTRIQVVRKSSQIGFSTMMILKSFWNAKYRNFNIIYTLPTFSDVFQFVPSKVNALLINNPLTLQDWTKDKDTMLQKKVGKSFIYYRGTFAKGTEGHKMESATGIMFSSDINLHDECDRSDQSIIEQYESRLEASDYGGRWYFSNPTTPHTLSQKLYEQSDQKHWFIKCKHCNHWQYLDYWKNIRDGKFVCEKCGGEISDEVRRNGQWIKKYSNRDISGYWIPHMIAPWISAEKIEQAEKTKTKQYFYNFILALPYIGSDITINEDIILKCIDPQKTNSQQHNVLGIDIGVSKNYTLINSEGIFKIGKTKDWEDIENLIKVYDVEMCVIDGMPDITVPRKMREKYPGKVWLCFFKKEIKKADYIFWDYKTHTVFADRTKIIQNTIDKLVNREIRFQINLEDLGEYINHWKSLYKIVEKDNMGIERDIWESSGEDHYVFSTIYAMIGMEKLGSGETTIKDYAEKKEVYDNLAPDIKKILEEQNQLDNL